MYHRKQLIKEIRLNHLLFCNVDCFSFEKLFIAGTYLCNKSLIIVTRKTKLQPHNWNKKIINKTIMPCMYNKYIK